MVVCVGAVAVAGYLEITECLEVESDFKDMQCVFPVYVKRIAKTVPCNKCLACKKKLQSEWAGRLAVELEHASTAHFVTFTYNDDFTYKFLPIGDNNEPLLDSSHFIRFLKRIRNFVDRGIPEYYSGKKVSEIALKGQKFKYFIIGEYGTKNNRPHWHALFFNLPYDNVNLDRVLDFLWRQDNKPIGFIHFGTVTPGSIDYITDYLLKNDRKDTVRLISKGLGLCYINEKRIEYHQKKMVDNIRIIGNTKPMGRYLKDKVLTKKQQQLIAERKRDFYMDNYDIQKEVDKYNKLVLSVKHKLMKK